MDYRKRLLFKLFLYVPIFAFLYFIPVMGSSSDNTIEISPSLFSSNALMKGEEFKVDVNIQNIYTVSSVKVDLSWDSTLFELVYIEEGNFTKTFGSSIFVYDDSYANEGWIEDLCGELFIIPENVGNWSLAFLHFKVKEYGFSNITLHSSEILSVDSLLLPHLTNSGYLVITSPEVFGPEAHFFSKSYWCYTYETVYLNSSISNYGYDNLPIGSETVNPIEEYRWEFDYGENGSIEETMYGQTVSFIPDFIGNISITLNVFAPDPVPPSSPSYYENSSVTQIFHVVEGQPSKEVDVYTDKGGMGAFNSSEGYGPSEDVNVFGYVTYNDAPQAEKLVLFEVVNNMGDVIATRTIATDVNGIASFSFRLPFDPLELDAHFGRWWVTAIVDIAGDIAQDTVDFQYGYIDELICFDVYTDLGGEGFGVSSDIYGPQELVTVYAYVCYNGAPQQGKDVIFQLLNPSGVIWSTRTARSGFDGVAIWQVRLPWVSGTPEDLFGTWRINGMVDIAEHTKADFVDFEFNYLVEITNVVMYDKGVTNPEVPRNNYVSVLVELSNNRNSLIPTIVTINSYDVENMVLTYDYIPTIIPPNSSTVISSEVHIPTWAMVGSGWFYINSYSNNPISFGIPFCPEASTTLHILE
jgi:hypothetical protein